MRQKRESAPVHVYCLVPVFWFVHSFVYGCFLIVNENAIPGPGQFNNHNENKYGRKQLINLQGNQTCPGCNLPWPAPVLLSYSLQRGLGQQWVLLLGHRSIPVQCFLHVLQLKSFLHCSPSTQNDWWEQVSCRSPECFLRSPAMQCYDQPEWRTLLFLLY